MPVASRSFTVRGKGPFPMDMLRYDSAWPVDTVDAASIAHSFDPNAAATVWTIHLNSADRQSPTIARWDSFNAKIVIGD